MHSQSSRNIAIAMAVFVVLLSTVKSCRTMKPPIVHSPFFKYIEEVQADAHKYKKDMHVALTPVILYDYETDSILSYHESASGNFILINKPIFFYPDDYENLEKVCAKVADDYYEETLPDGRIVKYRLLIRDTTYSIETKIITQRREFDD